jgi:hypothetical protein
MHERPADPRERIAHVDHRLGLARLLQGHVKLTGAGAPELCFGPTLRLSPTDPLLITDVGTGRIRRAEPAEHPELLPAIAIVADVLAVHRHARSRRPLAERHGAPWRRCEPTPCSRLARVPDAAEQTLWQLLTELVEQPRRRALTPSIAAAADALGDGSWSGRPRRHAGDATSPALVHGLLVEAAGRWRATQLRGRERAASHRVADLPRLDPAIAILDVDGGEWERDLVVRTNVRTQLEGTAIHRSLVLWRSELVRLADALGELAGIQPGREPLRALELRTAIGDVLAGRAMPE